MIPLHLAWIRRGMAKPPLRCAVLLVPSPSETWFRGMLLLLFLTFSELVANPKKLLNTVANPARGVLNREKRTKEKVLQHAPLHPPTLLVRRK